MKEKRTKKTFLAMIVCLGLMLSCLTSQIVYAKSKEIRMKFAFYIPSKSDFFSLKFGCLFWYK